MTLNRLRPALLACAATLTLFSAGVLTNVAVAKPPSARSTNAPATLAASQASAASAATAAKAPTASGKALPSVAIPAAMPVTPVVAPAAAASTQVTSPSAAPATAAVINPAPAPGLASTLASSEPTSSNESALIADGQATRTWISAQAHGKQASRTQQTLSGPVMGAVEKRYIESFSRPVPERFSAAK
jgi:hypothetical protein